MAQNLPRGTPARVLVLLALLIGLVAVSAWRDALRRGAATWVHHPTALGDTGLILPGQPPVRLTMGGKAITLTTGAAIFNRRDDRMFRVVTGFGENLPFNVFSTRETLGAEAEPRLYARLAPNQFVRLRANLDGPGAHSDGLAPPPSVLPPPVPETPVLKAIPLGPEEVDFPAKTPENGAL